MASKPHRTLNSSPTNLSPSRVAMRNSSRSSGGTNGSKKGPSSPLSTNTAGRTPQTRRKELALQNSPVGSPKNGSAKKSTLTGERTPGAALPDSKSQNRKNSWKNSQNSAGNRRQPRGRLSATTQPEKPVKLREETKFDGLWDVKTIRDGCVRIPAQFLDELITKDSIEKFYEVEDNPVAW